MARHAIPRRHRRRVVLAGITYGAQYGGAICSIPLNLPCHPPHAGTCLDGFPLTRQGKGGTALGITILAAVFGAAFGILEMVSFAPIVARVAYEFGPTEIRTLMLLGLLAGSTLAEGSPLEGAAMTILGLLLGLVGTDLTTGTERFTSLTHPIGAGFLAVSLSLIALQLYLRLVRRARPPVAIPSDAFE